MHSVENIAELEYFLRADLTQFDVETRIDHAGIRLSSALHQLAGAIKRGERSAVDIGYRLIMQDPSMPFGKLSKSTIARALKQRRELLTEHEKDALAGKTAKLLSLPFCPREVEDYCRLVKKLGTAQATVAANSATPLNDKARSLVAYLRDAPE